MRTSVAFVAVAAIAVALSQPFASSGLLSPGAAWAQDGRGQGPRDSRPAQPHEIDPGAVEPGKGPAAKRGSGPNAKRGEAAEPKPIPKSLRRPGGTSVPEGAGERARLLSELYAHLATARDADVAGRIANAIEHVWLTSGSETVSLLIDRATRAAAEKKNDLALRLLDRAVVLAPDYAEVFNRRAAVHFGANNLEQALGDLRRVLALDPNHYKALEGLGQILKEIDRKKAALEVFRRLYQVHPQMQGVKSTLEELTREVEGQPS